MPKIVKKHVLKNISGAVRWSAKDAYWLNVVLRLSILIVGQCLCLRSLVLELMKNLSIFGVPVAVGLVALNACFLEAEHLSHPRPEYVPYPYLKIQLKVSQCDIGCGDFCML